MPRFFFAAGHRPSKRHTEVLRQAILLLLALAASGRAANAQSSFHEGFEGPTPSLQAAGGDATYRLAAQVRSKQSPHGGVFCEALKVVGDNGQSVYFDLEIGQALIISELTPSVWVRSDRPGLQVFARAVLPRARNPKSGEPLTTLVPGSGYTQAGSWQQLRLENIERLFERQVRALRAQFGKAVDPTGAYIDRLVINVYGGPGATTVWIDDVDIAGIVPPSAVSTRPAVAQAAAAETSIQPQRLPAAWTGPQSSPDGRHHVRLVGTVLQVDDAPFPVRAIEHRGERLAFLQSLGFNVAVTASTPSPDLLREAADAGVWLVAPPPALEELARDPDAPIGAQFAPVLAWHLGSGLTERELSHTKAWARQLKLADRSGRPILASPQSELRAFGHSLDIVLADRPVISTTLDLWDSFGWLKQRAQLNRLGTPLWSTIDTQPASAWREQAAALTGGNLDRTSASYSQVRALSFLALAAGARGLVFRSGAALDEPGDAARTRATALALLNAELNLIDPWISEAGGATVIDANESELAGVMLVTAKGRLLVPVPRKEGLQVAFGGWPTGPASFTIPGASEASDAYELTPAGLKPLPHKRVTGGIRVSVDKCHESLILLTQDRLLLAKLSKQIAKTAEQAVQLKRAIAADQLAFSRADESPSAEPATSRQPKSSDPIAAARKRLAELETKSPIGGPAAAWQQASSALESVCNAQHGLLMQGTEADAIMNDPLRQHLMTLALAQQAESRALNINSNVLPSGDFENLDAMLRAGWRHFQHRQAGVTQSVELSAESPHGGRYSLRLSAKPERKQDGESVLESPPVWVTAPPVAVQPGDRVTIRGFVRAAAPITGSIDGLMIADSLGGQALAARIRETDGWKAFTLVRAATSSGPMTLTFALTGFGEVDLDDVTIEASSGKQIQRDPGVARGLSRTLGTR
jgi:hypothetical protein